MTMAGAALIVLAVLSLLWPWLVAWPLALLAGWSALALLVRAWALHRARRPADAAAPRSARPPDG